MKTVASDLEKVEGQLSSYQLVRTENLIDKQPDFTIRFDCLLTAMKAPDFVGAQTQSKSQTKLQPPSTITNTVNTKFEPSIVSKHRLYLTSNSDLYEEEVGLHYCFGHLLDDEDDPLRWYLDSDSSIDVDHNYVYPSYNVSRMATDGENVLYTCYKDEGQDLIAYCIMNIDDDDRYPDEYRLWRYLRIKDMIWWNNIRKFVCATENHIHTVDHTGKRFRISNVLGGIWSYIRVAANANELYLWMHCIDNGFYGIKVFSSNFHLTRIIDFHANGIGWFVHSSTSFCVTNEYIASICTRTQGNRQVFQATFCDLNMKKLNSMPLGQYEGDIEIRTDGDERFFVTTGTRRFYIIHSIDKKQIIELEDKVNVMAVLEDQRIAVSGQVNAIEIVTY